MRGTSMVDQEAQRWGGRRWRLIDGGGGDDEREVGSESFMSLVEVIKLGRVEEKR